MQRLEKILAQTAALRMPQWPSYANFCKVTQNPHFLKKCKRGTKGNLSKIAQKVALVWKAQKQSCAKWHYLLISIHLKCKDWRRFKRKQRLKKWPNGQVMSIFGRSPKTRIFRKSAKKRPREIFQKSPKKKLRFKEPTALWRKCHYPLNCIHL